MVKQLPLICFSVKNKTILSRPIYHSSRTLKNIVLNLVSRYICATLLHKRTFTMFTLTIEQIIFCMLNLCVKDVDWVLCAKCLWAKYPFHGLKNQHKYSFTIRRAILDGFCKSGNSKAFQIYQIHYTTIWTNANNPECTMIPPHDLWPNLVLM